MLPETARQPAMATRDRRHVPADRESVSKAARCLCTENKFEDGAVIDIQALIDNGVIYDVKDGVKVIGGELTKKLTVKVNAVSEGAKEKIEALGGTVEVVE